MKLTYKIIIAVVVIVIIALIALPIISRISDNNLIKETKREAELKFQLKQLQADYDKVKQQRDEAVNQYNITSALYEEQKKHPQIIIKNYEIKRDSINNLSPSDAYKLFTNNINKYKYNRERYNLSRYK